MSRLVISVVVEPGPAHDTIRVWVRGQSVGALTVGAGDGDAIAVRLCSPPICRSPDPDLRPETVEDEQGRVAYCEPAAATTIPDTAEYTRTEIGSLRDVLGKARDDRITAREALAKLAAVRRQAEKWMERSDEFEEAGDALLEILGPAENLERTPEERAQLLAEIDAALKRQVTARFVEVPRSPDADAFDAETRKRGGK